MVLDNNDVPKPYSSSPKVHAEMALAFGDSYPAAQNTGAQRVHLDADGRGCPMSPGEEQSPVCILAGMMGCGLQARILRHRREIAVRAVRWGWVTTGANTGLMLGGDNSEHLQRRAPCR